jgi:hypothetical protein
VRKTALVLGIFIPSVAQASIVPFTESSPFLAALPGAANTVDFEELSPGTLIPSGSSVEGVTFTYDFGGESLKATDAFDTTSAPHSLGLTGADSALLDRDELQLVFAAPIIAFGLFVITSDPALAGEIQVVTAEGVAQNSATAEKVLADTGRAYFIGLISSVPFSTVTLDFTDDGKHFSYLVDDVVSAVPEPDWLLGVVVGASSLRCSMRWRRAAPARGGKHAQQLSAHI